MPNIQSAKKALRQSLRRQVRNARRTEAYKKIVSRIRKLAAAGNIEAARTLVPRLYQALDKAAKMSTIKKNKAGRLKSRIVTSLARKN